MDSVQCGRQEEGPQQKQSQPACLSTEWRRTRELLPAVMPRRYLTMGE